MVIGAIEIDGAHRPAWGCRASRSHGNAPSPGKSPGFCCVLAAAHSRLPEGPGSSQPRDTALGWPLEASNFLTKFVQGP